MKTFKSFKEYEDHIKKLIATEAVYKKAALHTAGSYLKGAGKRKFGVYQKDNGLYEEWTELKSSTQSQREKAGFSPNDPLHRSGKLMDSLEYVVKGDSVINGSRDPIMAYQELGTIHIPPRPVLGAAMFESRDKIKKIISLSMKLWLTDQNIKKLKGGYGAF